jgi:hypothetical protein
MDLRFDIAEDGQPILPGQDIEQHPVDGVESGIDQGL